MKTLLLIKRLLELRIIAVSIVLVIFSISCTEEEDITDSLVKTGGFVRFESIPPPTTVGVNSIDELNYNFTLIDGNKNIESYEISLTANLSGVQTDTVLIQTVNKFPASFSFNTASFADHLGVTAADISFGDNFNFLATAKTTDGLTYSYERIDFDKTVIDPDEPDIFEYTIKGGGISDDIFDEAGYKQAFDFGFVILCPSAEVNDLVGTFDVDDHLFDLYFGPQGSTRQVILGPGDNELTIVGGALPLDGADDLIIKIDPVTSEVSYAGGDSAIHFNTFGPGTYAEVKGYVFSCIGVIQIEIISDGFISNFLTLSKQ